MSAFRYSPARAATGSSAAGFDRAGQPRDPFSAPFPPPPASAGPQPPSSALLLERGEDRSTLARRERRPLDAMKERASAPGGCWKVQASVSTRQGGPYLHEDYDGRQVVGVDLHRRRSVLVRMTEDGRRLGTARITNSPAELRKEIGRAGKSPRVVLEATYGWYWAADTLAAAGAEVHLAHPLGVKAFTYRRGLNPSHSPEA